jgi:hypothetical protein
MTELHGEHVVLRPVIETDLPALRVIRETPEVVRWWNRPAAGWGRMPCARLRAT